MALSNLILLAKSKAVELNYASESVRKMNSAWKRFEKHCEEHDISTYDTEFAVSYMREKYNYPNEKITRHSSYVNGVASAIRKLGDMHFHGTFLGREKKILSFPSKEFTIAIQKFTDYQTKRGITKNSLERHLRRLNSFLVFLQEKQIEKFQDITASMISKYFTALSVYSRKTVESEIYVVRSFLRSLYFSGITTTDLSELIPKMRPTWSDKVPTVWEKDDIEKLLAAVDRASPIGKRNYAIMLIVTKLGLRDGDVRMLTFENINWRQNQIEFVQSKTGQSVSLPLPKDIGSAIIDYLKNGRPVSNSPQIFIKHTAPYDHIAKAGNVVTKYLRLAHISIDKTKHYGIHSLRHTLASRLLEQSVPLEQISAILGHLSTNSAKAYLHIDIESLRKCALEVERDAI
jgi:integrase/recombinase XerD